LSDYRYDVCAISDALTDYILLVDESQVAELGLFKGRSFAVDETLRCKLEAHFAKAPDDVIITAGGSPANTAHGASRLNLSCAFIGCVGNDDNGYAYIARLRDNGIETFVSIKEGRSGIAYTLVTPDGERTFGVDFGVTKQLMEYELLYEVMADTRYLHYSAYELRGDHPLSEATRTAHRKVAEMGGRISFDLADARLLDLHREVIEAQLAAGVHVVFANQDEATRYSDPGCDRMDLGQRLDPFAEVVVVKLGADGCLIRTGGESILVRTEAVDRPLDTNGAGDAFQAGFLYGLCQELALPTCARIGNYYASRVIQVLGAQSGVRLEGIEHLIPEL